MVEAKRLVCPSKEQYHVVNLTYCEVMETAMQEIITRSEFISLVRSCYTHYLKSRVRHHV